MNSSDKSKTRARQPVTTTLCKVTGLSRKIRQAEIAGKLAVTWLSETPANSLSQVVTKKIRQPNTAAARINAGVGISFGALSRLSRVFEQSTPEKHFSPCEETAR